MYRNLLTLIVLCFSTGTGWSDAVQCDAVDIRVVAPSEVAAQVCTSAVRASDLLASCGLEPDWPVEILVTDVIEGAPPHCIGQFVCGTGQITLLSPDVLAQRPDTAVMFPGITTADIFSSLVAHELAHAALSHTAPGPSSDRTTQEYVATAIQFQTLAPADRARFLEAWEVETPVTPEGLNMFTLALAPGMFMSRAWQHFSAPENGCAFVGKLINGSVTLGVPDL